MKSSALVLAALALAGCATQHNPIPDNYSGPRAHIADKWSLDVNERDQVFAVLEVDGKPISNAVSNTRGASAGRGFQVVQRGAEREVPAGKLQLKIIGTHFSSAPIAEMVRRAAGTFQSVEGVVALDAVAGGRYVVTGELSKAGSCVWIAETPSDKPVTEKICSK